MILYDSTEDPVKVWERWAKQHDPLVRAKRWLKLKLVKLKRKMRG
jgi:hypothetical protein